MDLDNPPPASSPSPRVKTFAIPTGDSRSSISVSIVEPAGVKSDNLPLSTWASSLILARALHKLGLERHVGNDDEGGGKSKDDDLNHEPSSSSPPLPPPFSILELGAGTGLVGLAATLLLRAPSAVLTDLPAIVPGVAANVAVNAETLMAAGKTTSAAVASPVVRVGALDWSAPENMEVFLSSSSPKHKGSASTADEDQGREAVPSSRKATLLFAADTVYDEEHPALLEQVVCAWMDRSAAARFVICYPLRVAYLDQIRELWDRLEAAGMECETESRDTGEVTNGDDELLCEYAVWKWKNIA